MLPLAAGTRCRVAAAAVALLAACSEVGGGEAADAGGGADAGAAVDAGGADGASAAAPEVYPTDRTLSPITPYVADNLRAIAARAAMQDDVFAKIGASATVSTRFMHCFASGDVLLDGRDELAPTIAHFLAGDAGGTDPYTRDSLSATVGWSAGAALSGDPSPLGQEVAAISPRFAVIMYGTNDIQLGDIDAYGANLLDIADQLMAVGVVPVFTTIMPRDDSVDADAEVPRYNLVVRGVAQGRQVPLIDFHRELEPLPDHGLGPDGIHPSVFVDGSGARACVFDGEGLLYGYNIRNLITIQTLDRLRRVVVDGASAPDAPVRTVSGAGSPADPFAIDSLPFTHVANTRESLNHTIDTYDGCAATQDESGAEYFYRLELAVPARVRAMVIDRGTTDIDVHLLSGTDGGSCIARDHHVVVADLAAGTYYFSLDSFVSGGPLEGEYLFAVLAEP